MSETIGITLGRFHHAGFITFGFLGKAGSHTSGLRNDVIGVSLTFIDLAFTVLTGLHRIIESRLYGLRRLSILNGHTHHLDTGVITIEHFLHDLFDVFSDFLLAFKKHAVHLLTTDHFTHGAFSRLSDRLIRIAGSEDVIHGAVAGLNTVLNVKAQVNDIFIVGEHQCFGLAVGATHGSDGYSTDTAHVNNIGLLNGERNVPAETRHGRFGISTEGGHDTRLTFGHNVKPGSSPKTHHHNCGKG